MAFDENSMRNEEKGGYDPLELDRLEPPEATVGNGFRNVECSNVCAKVRDDGVRPCEGSTVYVGKVEVSCCVV